MANIQVDLQGFLEAKKRELSMVGSNSTNDEIERLKDALQSIAKRQIYCYFHYDQFIQSSSSKSLLIDRLDHSNKPPEKVVRTAYEAHSLAFLHNLHSLIDSLPYVLNIMFRVVPNIESGKIRWSREFIEEYNLSYPSIYSRMNGFYNKKLFHQLKGFANRTKHKHLIRIRNNLEKLIFEDFEYTYRDQKMMLKNQGVKEFMIYCHDILLPECFQLYNFIKESKEKQYP